MLGTSPVTCSRSLQVPALAAGWAAHVAAEAIAVHGQGPDVTASSSRPASQLWAAPWVPQCQGGML